MREEFKNQLFLHETIDQSPIVYIDESGFSVDTPRDCGYSKTGARCYASKDWHSRGRVNAIGAICEFKILNVCLFEGNINSDVFYAWLTKELFFSLPEKAVIVLDNATFQQH